MTTKKTKYNDATNKALEQQLGSLISKKEEKPKPVSTYKPYVPYTPYRAPDPYVPPSNYGNSSEDDHYLDDSLGSYGDYRDYGTSSDSSEEVDDMDSAEYIIQQMEMYPDKVRQYAANESVQTIADIITVLLYR